MTRHRRLLIVAVTVGTAVALSATGSVATTANDNSLDGRSFVFERLDGYAETPLAVSTPGSAQLRMQINDRAQEITWRLSYTDLATAVTQAHIHFGSPSQTGGISFFLCTNLGNGPAGTQPCPAAPAMISGTVRPADVIGPAAQGIAAGEFEEIVRAMRAGSTYANVHTTQFPIGEVRGQINHGHR
jgi:CHRD domain